MNIRKATLEDVPELVELAQDLMEHNAHVNREDASGIEQLRLDPGSRGLWRRWASKNVRSKDSLVLVAEEKGRIIGYSLNLIKENVPVYVIKETGRMSDLYVSPGYRRKGIATRFKEKAFEWFRKKRVRYASICVYPKNVKAHRVYRDWGFRDYHVELRRKL
ncbi:MAG: GNAT family N-acetyltransferase [Candidatus Bilamarchaeaceae archaeon]